MSDDTFGSAKLASVMIALVKIAPFVVISRSSFGQTRAPILDNFVLALTRQGCPDRVQTGFEATKTAPTGCDGFGCRMLYQMVAAIKGPKEARPTLIGCGKQICAGLSDHPKIGRIFNCYIIMFLQNVDS